jgi:hypothetical protein
MNQGKYVFAQIANFLPQRVFDRLVVQYNGNHRIRHFSCWNQMMCMLFGQLSNRDSLSDLVVTINAHPQKSYHLGFSKSVSKANLAKANENRDWHIYQDFAFHLIGEARRICFQDQQNAFSFPNPIYAFDSTIIDLCLNVFWWATFRKTKGAIKIHSQYDVRSSIPVLVEVTAASVHDVHGMDMMSYEKGSYYIFDRAYMDFKRLYVIHLSGSFFIVRSKNNLKSERIYSSPVDKSRGILLDQIVVLKSFYPRKGYPEKIRKIRFHDMEQNRTFIFLTNNTDLEAIEIANLYKQRWQIELFFKWIKQHLKIKSFWGTSMNAVKTQVYIAVIAYTTVAIIRQKLKSAYSTYEILQILGTSLLDKTPIQQLLHKKNNQDVKELLYNQLKMF